MEKRGILIVFEGVDGAGKTTQVASLEAYLQSIGEDVVRSKEPTDGIWGKKIRASAQTGRMPVEEELASAKSPIAVTLQHYPHFAAVVRSAPA